MLVAVRVLNEGGDPKVTRRKAPDAAISGNVETAAAEASAA